MNTLNAQQGLMRLFLQGAVNKYSPQTHADTSFPYTSAPEQYHGILSGMENISLDTAPMGLVRNFMQGTKLFHGTHYGNTNKILSEGVLRPYGYPGVEKIGGGLTTEKGIVWFSKDFDIAKHFSNAPEAHGRPVPAGPGSVFIHELKKNMKLVDRSEPLTAEQINLLNKSGLIPDYKPLKSGDSISNAEWRLREEHGLKDILNVLGVDGITYGPKQSQVGILSDALDAKLYKEGQ